MKLRRKILTSLTVLLLVSVCYAALVVEAQTGGAQVSSSSGKGRAGGAFVIYQNDSGDVTCRVGDTAERRRISDRTAGGEMRVIYAGAPPTGEGSRFTQEGPGTGALPPELSPAQFVDALNKNAGNVLTPTQRDALVAQLVANNTAQTRASVLRQVAENQTLKSNEFNRAFVLMQYFGYLRRDPNAPPDNNFSGYNFWLSKLNQFGGNFVSAELVKAFITSTEYRTRFAP